MKKVIVVLLLQLTLMFFTGCNKKQEPPVKQETALMNFDSTDIKATPLNENEAQNLLLKYRPLKGSTYTFRLTSITNDEGIIIADTTVNPKTSQTLTYLVALNTNEIEEDSTYDISITIRSVKLDASMNGRNIHYQSGEKTDSATRNKFLEYEALQNIPFCARIKQTGEVIELYKTSKIIDKVLSLRGIKDSIKENEKKAFQQNVEEGGLRPIVLQLFRKLSSNPVSKNASWTVEQPFLNMNIFGFSSKQIFTLTGVEQLNNDKVASIDVRLVSQVQLNEQAKKNNVKIDKALLEGEGKLYFNMSKNMVQKSKTKVLLITSISGVVPGPKGMQKFSSQKTVTTSNILELLEVK